MLADILQAHGSRVAHNRSGSNLVRGVASALASQSDLTGSPRADIGVIESDEAAFPEIVRRVQPSVVLLNNLFRDQLDRYGELDTIASQWAPALRGLPAKATVVVNADDPTLAAITEGINARRVTFGLDDCNPAFCWTRFRMPRTPRPAGTVDWISPTIGCTVPILGRGAVRAVASRARPWISREHPSCWTVSTHCVLKVSLPEDRKARSRLQLMIPGLYNAYNAVAATAVADTLGVPRQTIADALRGVPIGVWPNRACDLSRPLVDTRPGQESGRVQRDLAHAHRGDRRSRPCPR